MNYAKQGNQAKYKVKALFIKNGYECDLLEHYQTIYKKGATPIQIKRDIFGADGCAHSKERIILWGCTTSKDSGLFSKQKKKLLAFLFPDTVERVIFVWPVGEKPRIYDVDKGEWQLDFWRTGVVQPALIKK